MVPDLERLKVGRFLERPPEVPELLTLDVQPFELE